MLNYQRVDQHVPMGNRQDSSLVALVALLGPGLSVFSFFSGASAILPGTWATSENSVQIWKT